MHAVEGVNFEFVLLDTRSPRTFANGHVPGALCALMEELESLMLAFAKDKEIAT